MVFGTNRCSSYHKVFSSKNRERAAHADALKEEVHAMIHDDNLSFISPSTDSRKDSEVYYCSKLNLTGTLRDHYIEHGRRERLKDPDIWAKKTQETIEKFIQSQNMADELIIDNPDWRFKNEFTYLSSSKMIDDPAIITMRLFRAEVPIPNYDISSEHSLDNIETDFLLVTSWWSLVKVVYLMPCYTDHYFQGVIV